MTDALSRLFSEYESRAEPEERPFLPRFRALVAEEPRCARRDCFPGHLTASALVFDPRGRVLFTLHRKLGKWLQVGGHADGDLDLAAVALREAREESGLADLRFHSRAPFDVDIHGIPANSREPAHEHYDVRYLLRTETPEAIALSDESLDLKWFPLEEALAVTGEPGLRRMLRKARGLLALCLALSLAACGGVRERIDPAFGEGGLLFVDITEGRDDVCLAAARGEDDSLVAVGRTDRNGGDFAVARYRADGSPDGGFGTKGTVTTDFGGEDEARAVALLPDGRILVAGETIRSGRRAIALARYGADGKPDSGFGSNGLVVDGGSDAVTAHAVTPDKRGGFWIAGATFRRGRAEFLLRHYQSDGRPDRTILSPIGAREDIATAVALQGDGKLVAAGTSVREGRRELVVARYRTNGTLDSGFGTAGKTMFAVLEGADVSSLLPLPDGRFLVGGSAESGERSRMFVARLRRDGTPDRDFNGTGLAFAEDGDRSLRGRSLVRDAAGNLLLAGDGAAGDSRVMVVARFTPAGLLDETFGRDGRLVAVAGGREDSAAGILLQGDGGWVLAGTALRDTHRDFALLRFLP